MTAVSAVSSLDLRRRLSGDRGIALGLVALSAAVVVGIGINPEAVPVVGAFVPLVLAVLLLSNRLMVAYAFYMLLVITAATLLQDDITARTGSAIVAMYLLTLAVIGVGRGPGRLAVSRLRGESMLVDLRDRILAQGQIPPLPAGWAVESAIASAGGTGFAGDFIVANLGERGRRIDLVVVDVSGKGEAAGTRALQLSGAMGGLVGALPPSGFLAAANDYLLQRSWEEGFASAVHLSVDLVDGSFELRSAGHPPAVQRHAGSGRWQVLRAEGQVLGVLEDVDFEPLRGRLAPGDALMLYTDGMVEEPRRDIELGIDQMMGEAESLLRGSWDGLAARLVAAVGSPDDDRALLVVHRRG